MTNSENTKVIGITGGIASGKSVFQSVIEARGFPYVDADEVSRALTAPGQMLERRIAERYPDCLTDGYIDRKKIREKVFASKNALKEYNALTHPPIFDEIQNRIKNHPIVFLIVPLMFETGANALCDIVISVTCPPSVRKARLMARSDLDGKTAQAIIDSQLNEDERNDASDIVVNSDCDKKLFIKRCEAVIKKVTEE